MNNNQKIKLSKSYLISIVIISLMVGGLSGGVMGFISSSVFSGSLNQWLSNPLGITKFIKPSGQSALKQSQSSTSGSISVAEEESLTTQAVQKVAPTVVSIIITKELQSYYNYSGPGFPFDDFFGLPFEFNLPQTVPGPKEKREVGGGTGFIVSSDGLILTNKHVVSDTTAEYSVILNDGKRYDAQVLARDPFNDIAFIKIEAPDLPVVELGDSDKIKIGQTVLAIGFSLGEYSNSVTKGIISGTGRDVMAGGGGQSEKLEGVFQTDAAINYGNSGGPLINLQGQVIGINTAINQEGQLVGFAIPINSAKPLIVSVKEKGKIIRPYLGVRYIMLTEEIAKQNQLPVNYGALLIRGDNPSELAVIAGGPADQAGLEENDIILEFNGIKLDDNNTLAEEIAKHQPGDTVTLKILHDGQEKTVNVVLGEFEQQ